ncbi:fimbrial protein [Klebsiella sp. R445]
MNIIKCLILCFVILPNAAMAFRCVPSGGVVYVDVNLSNATDDIIIKDLSENVSCSGIASYKDALRTTSTSTYISPELKNLGYKGFVKIFNDTYLMPVGYRCVWLDTACSPPPTGWFPLRLAIGMRQINPTSQAGINIPAGTEIASLRVEQRSNMGNSSGPLQWSWPITWSFVLNNPMVIPAKTCKVNNPNNTVELSEVKKNALLNNPGRYPSGKDFNIELECTPQTKVSVKFEGTTMPGQDSVLANQTTGDGSAGASVGIQMLYDNNPVTLGQPLQVLSNAQSSEQLPFSAHYYYNGGADIQAGNVTATTTFNFTYQ